MPQEKRSSVNLRVKYTKAWDHVGLIFSYIRLVEFCG